MNNKQFTTITSRDKRYSFMYHGKSYLVNTIVRLTDEAKYYLDAYKDEAILTGSFYMKDRLWWKYEFLANGINKKVRYMATCAPPEEMIAEIIMPATYEYLERKIFGINAPSYKNGKKQTPNEWNIPEIRKGWIVFVLICIGSAIFKDWYIKILIRLFAFVYFSVYRKIWIDANTIYTHDEDTEMLKKEWEVLHK